MAWLKTWNSFLNKNIDLYFVYAYPRRVEDLDVPRLVWLEVWGLIFNIVVVDSTVDHIVKRFILIWYNT